MKEIYELFYRAFKGRATDLHLKSGKKPLIRVDGALKELEGGEILSADFIDQTTELMMPEMAKRQFKEKLGADFSFDIPGLGRFRGNLYQERGKKAIVCRRIPAMIHTIQSLELPEVLCSLAEKQKGLILVTGPAGSGKSTTLAAMIDHINRLRSWNIITLEDPIEYVFEDKKSTISQREIGIDTPSFEEGLRSLLRHDPNVIMVGEMRDLSSVRAVVRSAETGHLVFSTLHTANTVETINRIIDLMPQEEKPQTIIQLAMSLVAIISQQLLPRADGSGRIAAVEILINSPQISDCILKGEIQEIPSIIEKSVAYYKMQTMNQSLLALWANRAITKEVALSASKYPEELASSYERLFYKDHINTEGEMSRADYSKIQELIELREKVEIITQEFKAEINNKEKEIQELKKELAKNARAYEQLETQYKKLVSQIDTMVREREFAWKEIENLKKALAEKNAELDLVRKELEERKKGFFRK